MELAVGMEAARAKVLLQWAPRELNAEADSLSNLQTEGFDPDLRVKVDWLELRARWVVLERLVAAGARFLAEREALRVLGGRGPPGRAARTGKRPREQRLRARDPW